MPNPENPTLDVEALNRFRRSVILAFAAAALAWCVQAQAQARPGQREGEYEVLSSIKPKATLVIPTVTPQGDYKVFVPRLSNKEQPAVTIQPTATATPEQPTATPEPIQTIVPTKEVIKDYELNSEAGFTESMNRIMGNSWQSLLPEGWRYGDPISMELFESLEVNKPIRNWEAYHTPDHIKYIKNHSVERFLPYGELEVNFYHGMDSIVSNWKGSFLPPNWKYGDRVSKDLYVFLSLNVPAWESRFSPSNVQYINNYDPNLTGYGGQLPSDGGNGFPILPTPETGPVQPGQPVELPGMPIEDYLDQILPDWRNHIPTDWKIGDPLPQELVSYLDQNIPNWRDSVPPGYPTSPEILPIPTPRGNP